MLALVMVERRESGMRISELAKRTGLSAHTLRFYEKQGLVSHRSRSEGGYREYDEADLRRVEFVRSARNVGFSLEDISTLLSIRVDKDAHSCEQVAAITRRKLGEVEERLRELRSMKKTLGILLDSCCGGPESAIHCSIMEALEHGSVSHPKTEASRQS